LRLRGACDRGTCDATPAGALVEGRGEMAVSNRDVPRTTYAL
jgi:hypothetical protein